MIALQRIPTTAEIANHYDELDPYYRKIWGEHVHHGLWERGDENAEQAVIKMISLVACKAGLTRPGAVEGTFQTGSKVCDVGSGYGGTARAMAAEYGCEVVGITVSKVQFDYAVRQSQGSSSPRYLLCDWFQADLPRDFFDAVIAIESTEHMPNKARFFEKAFEVLKPGGRVVVCAWLAAQIVNSWQKRLLLEPICREGRLPSLGTKDDYENWITRSGLRLTESLDLTRNVKKTWSKCTWGMLRCLATDGRARALALGGTPNGVFAKTVLRLWASYASGSMRYGIFSAEKPDERS